jgi:hypothetical protein
MDGHRRNREAIARSDEPSSSAAVAAFDQNERSMREAWNRCREDLAEEAARENATQSRAAGDRAEDAAALAERKRQEADEERGREAHRQERRVVAERDDSRSKDPAWMRPVISAKLCESAAIRARAREEIAKEREYSREGGVTSKTALYAAQQEIREADEAEASLLDALKALRASRLPCGDPDVALVMRCYLDDLSRTAAAPDPANPCHTERAQQFVRLR